VSLAVDEVAVIETSEASIAYREIGEGPVLLLLHGGGPGATGWGNFSRNVDALKDRYRMIIPDHPGFGASRLTSDSGLEFPAISAKAMAELLAALGIEKAHVFGNSMGGGVALRMAIDYPDLVDRLVLMGPYLWRFAPQLLTPAAEGDPLLYHYYPDPTLERMRHLIRTFVFDPDGIDGVEDIIKARYEATLDPAIEAGYQRIFAAEVDDPDPRTPFEKVSSIAHKTLLLWGREDRFCNLTDAFVYLEALRNAELVVLRDTGHWVQVERPAEFAGYVTAFLER
jgi:2-hydroxy-6-oxonona-2,4-dienedioate hydrolase/4,5:9,10-diseco-3-hydroxy-5,9,17-trioxoandrosta-1(10),2-diene-4-oate hydrolase